MTKIKFCGITNLEDASRAVSLGVDALGFNFYEKSPRFIAPAAAFEIARTLPAEVLRVGVFVDADPAFVEHAAGTADLSVLQFHGNESPEYCKSMMNEDGLSVMKAIRMKPGAEAEEYRRFQSSCDFFLIDSYDPHAFGGTGNTVGSEDLERLDAAGLLRSAYLAGGLTPLNVRAVVARFRPYAVDVSSGIERSPGLKDEAKMTQFVAEVRSV